MKNEITKKEGGERMERKEVTRSKEERRERRIKGSRMKKREHREFEFSS